jgi:DNA-binding NtrC family response regulator
MKIIVVDDEPIIAATLVDILNGEGYKAVAISTGASAIKWASMMKPDVVISDVIMPGINGIDTAKEILKTCPKCRIILFSGQSASIDLLEKAKSEGFQFEILAKPVNPNRLLFALDRERYATANE